MSEKVCALMGCELEGHELSLGEIINNSPASSQGYHQAQVLIEEHGFKEEDILCDECFWK